MIPVDLHPSAAQVQKYPPFLNGCEALSRTTKNLYLRVFRTWYMVLSKHRPKAGGMGRELTEFHNEKKRKQNFGLKR
jgi:hypothetical protein